MNLQTRRAAALAGAALVAALAVPAGASALPTTGSIAVGKSMAGARIGMTQAQVRTAWGRPTSCALRRDARGRVRGTCTYGRLVAPTATVTFKAGKVTALAVMRRAWRTERGLRVGAKRADLGHGYGGELIDLGTSVYRLETPYRGHLNTTDFVVALPEPEESPNDLVVRIVIRLGHAI